MSKNPVEFPEKKGLAICVFCGSSSGTEPAYAATAKRLGELIAAHGHSLVFGGGNIGLMGEVARAARDGGAPVVGILPEFLKHLEPPLTAQEEVVITDDLQSRKKLMLALADAFVILPGGLGTLDEYFEVLTSAQLGALEKPIIVVDAADYFAPLKTLIDHLIAKGFARTETGMLHQFVPDSAAAIETINRLLASPPSV